MSDEGVLHEYRPSCAVSDCTNWPAPDRPFCASCEAKMAAGVKPGLSEEQWVGGVPPDVAKAKADALEPKFAAQMEDAIVADLVKDGWSEEDARIKAHALNRDKPQRLASVGPDPDTTYPTEVLRVDVPTWNQRVGIDPPEKQPFDPAAALRAYLDGAHGAVKQATAKVLLDAMLMVLARL
jgi:hypothetical protein